MSKLSVTGTAEMHFPVDTFEVNIMIRANAASSGEAIQSGKKKTEQFLTLMKEKINIEPDSFQLASDSVNEDYSCKNSYNYSKRITLNIKADLAVLSKLTSLLGELTNVEYDIGFYLSDEAEKENQEEYNKDSLHADDSGKYKDEDREEEKGYGGRQGSCF